MFVSLISVSLTNTLLPCLSVSRSVCFEGFPLVLTCCSFKKLSDNLVLSDYGVKLALRKTYRLIFTKEMLFFLLCIGLKRQSPEWDECVYK